jgi:anti-anti-sigma factor
VLAVAGDVDLATAPIMGETLAAEKRPVVLDLGEVTFMDSSGLTATGGR